LEAHDVDRECIVSAGIHRQNVVWVSTEVLISLSLLS